ncbi:MCE family protein [Nocardia thailandica]
MIIDPRGRGPRASTLCGAGIVLTAAVAAGVYLLGLRYTGAFADTVDVTASLTSTGDGMPPRADVKFRGVVVGAVAGVDIAAKGDRQVVRLELEPALAEAIPSSVTARVVPANLFGVTALELVDHGPAATGLRRGAVVAEDTGGGTAQLQATLTTLRTVLDAVQPLRLARVLGTLADALDPAARLPGSTLERLDTWTTEVRALPGIGTLLGDLGAAAAAVNQSAPDLVGALTSSITSARTLTEHRAELIALIAGADGAVGAVNELFARNPDAAEEIVPGLDDVFGALAADPSAPATAIANLEAALGRLATVFAWGPGRQMQWNVDVSVTPFRTYTAADCPRYGALTGPSCATAPAVGVTQDVPPSSAPGRAGAADPPAPSAIPGLPGIPGLPAIPGVTAPAARTGTTPGAYTGAAAIEALLGSRPTAAQLLLLGPVLADATVTTTPTPPTLGGR